MAKKNDGIGDLVRGALTGIAATWVMGRVAGLVREASRAPASGSSERGVELRTPTSDQPDWLLGLDRFIGGSEGAPPIPWEVGAGAGLLYGMLRGRIPGVDAASGLVYGAGFYVAADRSRDRSIQEALPWLAYGAASELTIRALEKVSK